jgi:peptidyl-tRNA hydrolase
MLKSDEFKRLKIGINTPRIIASTGQNMDLVDYVLAKFTDAELKELASAVEKGADAVEYMLKGETARAMNMFN